MILMTILPPSSPEQLLEALDPEQQAAALHLLGPVCVLAGAGTGKTRAITHRIAYGVRTGTYKPGAVLAVTFTTRAAGEMRQRLRQLGAPGVQARTFHSAALLQLKHFHYRLTGRKQLPQLVEHKGSLVAEAALRLGLEVDHIAVRDFAAEIEWAKVQLWTPEDYTRNAEQSGRPPVDGCSHAALAKLMRSYEAVLAENSAMDFEDVLLATAGLLADYPEAAAEVRQRYRHFVVDEYQDVSPAQEYLLRQWLGDRQELCVVGDPSQTIYSFSGATADYLQDFTKRYPQAPIIELVRNYRSTPQVINLANQVLQPNRKPVREDLPQRVLQLVATQNDGAAISYETYQHDAVEAKAVVEKINQLLSEGWQPQQIAVLFRTNAQSEPFEMALSWAGTPFQLRGTAGFYQRPETKAAISHLRTAARLSPAADQTVWDQAAEALARTGWTVRPPQINSGAQERWETLDALASLIHQLIEQGLSSLAEITAVILQRQADDHPPEGSGVTLASLHAAKGLEWPVVFLTGLADGLLPINLANDPKTRAE
ncbi:MAG: ATP-dependent helicase [Bifidobacteriaceae bacterium]|jgi:DNA helicase-2/ATP-dependent DNA helicase PcrA|nr:ATP-dependent helicase [Bifidobacteriaceae bacterium]